MKITLITPTGDRPEAFALTRMWMNYQEVKADQWIVIDDGWVPLPERLRAGVDYVRRTPLKEEGHTLTKNMRVALPLITGDAVLIIEDDDWYGPKYISTMKDLLNSYDLVGEANARYYHLPTMKYSRIGNGTHASLCQTGFRKEILPIFEKCLDGDPYIDMRIWSRVPDKKFLISDDNDNLKLHCSLKGLRGRKGIGSGHRSHSRYYKPDAGLRMLINWVGEENARIYVNHMGQSFESAKLVGRERLRSGAIVDSPSKKIIISGPPVKDITVITCTGDRPEAFRLLQIWMANQAIKPSQWIVIDDGKIPIQPSSDFEYCRREPTPTGFTHTLCLNMLEAIPRVKYEKVIIMEDDDWYAPTYISYMSDLLDKADIVGMGKLIFYYPSLMQYMEKGTLKQPAFGQTAFHRHVLPIIKEICDNAANEYELCGKGLIDVFLWKHPLKSIRDITCVQLGTDLKTTNGKILPKGAVFEPPIPGGIFRKAQRNQGAFFITRKMDYTSKKLIVNCENYLAVGMKGMPGRQGKTSHHKEDNSRYKPDEGHKLLKSILKTDAEFYINYAQKKA